MSRSRPDLDATQAAPSTAGPGAEVTLPAPSSVMATEDGRHPVRLAGRYEILGLLGAGGMGTVYRARDLELGEVVALKMLRRELMDTPILERFKTEVRLARRVTHKNVARVFDIGEHQSEKFLTMEFVEGESLAARLARERVPPLDQAMAIGEGICAGLGAAHAAGVVHRDLKPDNVLLAAADGRVVVTDFGIARTALPSFGGTETAAGAIVGTPAYMAPEQVEGRADIDARADVYALGATLFELFTGRRAWQGDVPIAVAAARLASPAPDPRTIRADLPDALAAVVRRCLERQPADRYADAGEVGLALAAAAPTAAPGASTASTGTGPAIGRSSPSGPGLPPAVAATTVAVLPMRNEGAAVDDYISEGITEDLIDTLSMVGLLVRPRAAVLKYAGSAAEPLEIGRQLGVQVVVDTSLRRLPSAVRVRARVLSVADGFQLWAKRYDRSEADLLVVSDEVARAIADAVTVRLDAPARAAPTDAAVVDLYLRARAELRQLRADPAIAVDLLEQAVARAPHDPTVVAALAMARARLWHFSGEGREAAEAAAERAVAAAPWLGDARLSLGLAAFYAGDYERAIREGRSAATLAPGLAAAYHLVGRLLCEAGAVDDGIRWLENSIEIDPKADAAYHDLSRAYELSGSTDEADRVAARCRAETGRRTILFLQARLCIWRRDADGARALLEAMASSEPFARTVRRLLEFFVAGSATEDDLRAIAPDLPTGAHVTARRTIFANQLMAEMACYFGHHEMALASLTGAADAGLVDLGWLDGCPTLAAIRGRPEFAAPRARVEERARRVIAAYQAPQEVRRGGVTRPA